MRSSTEKQGKQKRPKNTVVVIDLESKKDLVSQAVKSPCHSEGESVDGGDDDIADSSSQADDRRSHFTNTSVVKLAKPQDSNGEETSSMASVHSSSQGFGYILGADSQPRRRLGQGSFGGKLASRKKLLKGGQRSQQDASEEAASSSTGYVIKLHSCRSNREADDDDDMADMAGLDDGAASEDGQSSNVVLQINDSFDSV